MGLSIRRLLTLVGGLTALIAVAWPSGVLAAPAMPRSVWLLYSSQAPDRSRTQPLVAPLEAVLEHLGMIPRPWDLTKGVPDATGSVTSWGVISLLPSTAGLPHYDAWLKDRTTQGMPVVTFSRAAASPGDPEPVARVEDLAFVNPFSRQVRWYRDPYRWLDQGLHLEGLPRLDPTTIDGRRVFYAVVSATGFTTPSVRPGRPLDGEVLRNEVFSRTSLPLSIAVSGRDLKGHPRVEAIARSIFSLPNVEAAGTRSLDEYRLVSSGGPDGAALTHDWTGPLDGEIRAVDTYRETEGPRRVAPVAVSTSFKAGEHVASTEALMGLLRWAEREPLAPIWASDYARMIAGFYDATVTPDGAGAWAIAHAGECRTVRFDDEPRDADVEASRGVAGFVRVGRTLYVHLSADSGRVVLSAKPAQRPHLETANAPLTGWTQGPTSLAAAFDAKVSLRATFAGFGPQQVLRVKDKASERSCRADEHGRLSLALPSGHPDIEVIW